MDEPTFKNNIQYETEIVYVCVCVCVRACAAFTFAIVGKSAWIKKPNEISVAIRPSSFYGLHPFMA